MPVPISRPTGGKPWGALQDAVDWLNRAQGLTDRPDKMWQPGVRNFPAGYKESELRQGAAAEAFRPGAGFSGQSTPVIFGTRDGMTPDRTQSDLYKQYALNPQGQFDRYFGTGEMDRYFGAASRATGAPKDVAAMEALAGQAKAPAGTGVPLATYYRAQSAAGRGSMDEIVSGLTYGKTGKEAENLTAWAKANPMLAMREYNKRFPGGQPTTGTGELATTEALQGTRYQGVGGQGFGAATAPGSVQGMDSTSALSVPPELKPFTLPGGAFTQGRAVSAPYDTAQEQAAWKTNPQNWASQQIPGVSERAEEFIKRHKPFSDSKVDTLF